MSNSRELSLEESQEINEMMKDNASKSKLKSKSKSRQPPKKSKARQKADLQVEEAYKSMKKILKLRSKKELIEIVWNYGVQLREFQNVCQQLLEENKALKSILDEYDSNVDYYKEELAGSWLETQSKYKKLKES